MGNAVVMNEFSVAGWCVGRRDKVEKMHSDARDEEVPQEKGNETILIETRGSEMATLDKMLHEG